MLKLLLVRHGETDWNASGRYQGQIDVALNAAGRDQAVILAARLAATPIRAIHASELARAWETAEAIARVQGLDVRAEPRLLGPVVVRWNDAHHLTNGHRQGVF